jgi:hypothetical protein
MLCLATLAIAVVRAPQSVRDLLVERSAYVPRSDQETPVPDWKRRDEMRVLLSANELERPAL